MPEQPSSAKETPTVEIEINRTQINVTPERVGVFVGKTLIWDIHAENARDIVIRFETKKGYRGPFKEERHNRDERGVYQTDVGGTIETDVVDRRPLEEVDEEYWKYTVSWRTDGTISMFDPGVAVKK